MCALSDVLGRCRAEEASSPGEMRRIAQLTARTSRATRCQPGPEGAACLPIIHVGFFFFLVCVCGESGKQLITNGWRLCHLVLLSVCVLVEMLVLLKPRYFFSNT